MARTVKPRDDVELESFFSGVSELRAYLERHNQEPAHRHSRLAQLGTELLKPRKARQLAVWLTHEITESIGAAGAVLHVRAGPEGWSIAAKSGTIDPTSHGVILAGLAADASELQAFGDLWILPLRGLERVVAAVVLAAVTALDEDSRRLLNAIAGAAGAALEQGLMLEALGA